MKLARIAEGGTAGFPRVYHSLWGGLHRLTYSVPCGRKHRTLGLFTLFEQCYMWLVSDDVAVMWKLETN